LDPAGGFSLPGDPASPATDALAARLDREPRPGALVGLWRASSPPSNRPASASASTPR